MLKTSLDACILQIVKNNKVRKNRRTRSIFMSKDYVNFMKSVNVSLALKHKGNIYMHVCMSWASKFFT